MQFIPFSYDFASTLLYGLLMLVINATSYSICYNRLILADGTKILNGFESKYNVILDI